MGAETAIERLLAQSVKLNSVFIPIRSADSALARYAQCLLVHHDDPTYSVLLSGSAVALRYRARYFLVCTRHQLRGHELERVSMFGQDGKTLLSSGGVRHFREGFNEVDLHDIAVFDFTEPCEAVPILKERFFNFSTMPPDARTADIIFNIAAGYPFIDQLYNLAESNKLDLAKRVIICKPESQPSDETLLALKPVESLDFDPDGLSGGSSFTVQLVHGEPEAFFAGVIVRAGRDRIYIVKAGHIRTLLEQMVDIANIRVELDHREADSIQP